MLGVALVRPLGRWQLAMMAAAAAALLTIVAVFRPLTPAYDAEIFMRASNAVLHGLTLYPKPGTRAVYSGFSFVLFCGTAAASLIASPVVWSHYLVLLAAPFLAMRAKRRWLLALGITLAVVVFALGVPRRSPR